MRYLVFAHEFDELELKAESEDYDTVEVLLTEFGYVAYDVVEQIWTNEYGVMSNPPNVSDSALPRQYRDIFNNDEIGYSLDDLRDSYNMFKGE